MPALTDAYLAVTPPTCSTWPTLCLRALPVHTCTTMPGTGRFDLNVRLLDKSSKAAAADLCRQLQEVLQQQHQVQVQAQAQQQQLEGDLTEWREEDLTEQLQREQAGADSGCAGLSSTSSAHIAQDSLQELMHKLRV